MNESQHDQLNILPSPRGLYSLTALAASSFAFFRPQGAPDEISQRTGPGRTLEGCPSLSLSEGINVKVSASSIRPPSSESHATPRKSSFLFPLSLFLSLSLSLSPPIPRHLGALPMKMINFLSHSSLRTLLAFASTYDESFFFLPLSFPRRAPTHTISSPVPTASFFATACLNKRCESMARN